MALRIAAPQLNQLHDVLLAASPQEAGAFLHVEPSGQDLVVRSVRTFSGDELEASDGTLALTDEAKVALLAEAKRLGHGIVDVHTHPFANGRVGFSRLDLEELPKFARYVNLKLAGRPFAALVLGQRSYQGLAWTAAQSRPLDLVAIGEAYRQPAWLVPADSFRDAPEEFDRQVRAIGLASQARLSTIRVGIVGLGGVGSLVAQQLVHLGVRDFVLIEDDQVELSNLPRLVGSRRSDALQAVPKADVTRRLIEGIAEKPRIKSPGSLRTPESLYLLQGVDLILGCVDNDGARLILAELAASRLIPYLDLGVSVDVDDGVTRSLGGRVSFYLPGGACLACADEIDFAEAAEDLEDEALRNIRKHRGYARDRKVEAAVMPLNTVVVGAGMVEVLAFVSGIRPVRPFMRYEGTDQRMIGQNVLVNSDCPICVPAYGMGDRQAIERYRI